MEEVILCGNRAFITYADGRLELRTNMVPEAEDEEPFMLELAEEAPCTDPYAYS